MAPRSYPLLCLAPLLLLGCADEAAAPPTPATEEVVESAPPVAPAPEGPHLIRPDVSPAEGTLSGAGIAFDLPASWEPQPPANTMRVGQAAIPGPGGAGELAVFFFGPGGGGGTEANLQRWVSQMEPAPGAEPERQTWQSGPLTIHLLALEGTVLPSSMGMGPSDPVPDSMLLAAVVEGPGGPWFFKATGPRETLRAEMPAFEGMLRGIRLE
jgi:hypothetical protein